jgi:hypothetical protein
MRWPHGSKRMGANDMGKKLSASERRLKEKGERTPANLVEEICFLNTRQGGRGRVEPQISALTQELQDLVGHDEAGRLLNAAYGAKARDYVLSAA